MSFANGQSLCSAIYHLLGMQLRPFVLHFNKWDLEVSAVLGDVFACDNHWTIAVTDTLWLYMECADTPIYSIHRFSHI